jgi:predicted AlkP superfamily phosphohydrolase/phosphomutase
MNAKKISISKPIVSILELCQILQLSRARYYQLVESGFFPKPLIDDRSKRPYYDADLQAKCIEARHTGIGANGSYLLFYSPRKKETVAHVGKKKVDAQIQELTETLESMGLDVTAKQIQEALSQLFPDGTEQDQGLIIRQLYRHLKQK